MTRVQSASAPMGYRDYHRAMLKAGDIDPSYEMLRYVADRYELNMEQRYWLAWLYATCYCGSSTFFMYNEFPDCAGVDEGRLLRWWNASKQSLLFQTDRRWVRSRNDFVPMFGDYRRMIGSGTQQRLFESMVCADPHASYARCWDKMIQLPNFGRFSMFLYLEAVHVVTGLPIRPRSMVIADADNCREGLQHYIGRAESQADKTQRAFDALVAEMEAEDRRNSVWNIETSLCAYAKYRKGKRWIGYYLSRQADEIRHLEARVRHGVDWSVLWQYRKETYDHRHLVERA